MKPHDQPRVRNAMFLIVFGVFVYSVFNNPSRYAAGLNWVWKVVGTICWGCALAFLLNLIMSPVEGLINRIQGRFRHKLKPGGVRVASTLITIVVALIVIAIMLGTIIPSVVNIVQTVIAVLPEATEKASNWLTNKAPGLLPDYIDSAAVSNKIAEWLSETSDNLVKYLTDALGDYGTAALEFTAGIFGSLFNFIIVFVFGLYVLTGKEKVCKAARDVATAYIPERFRRFLFDFVSLMDDKFSLFFRGQVVEAVILGILTFIGMLIFGFPNAGLISVLMAVTAIVPVVGPWTGSITSILLVVIVDPFKGLMFAIYIMVLQQIEDNLIYPRVVGKTIGLPGILVLLAVIVGVKVAGMLGIIVGVPFCAVLFELMKKYVAARLAERKNDADAD